jgi:hypothetical protein
VRIDKRIALTSWDESTRQKIVEFWEERGVVFSDTAGDVLRGKRGSLWGNLTSYDMSKLRSKLTVTRSGPTEIECTLDVNTAMQRITDWNMAYWRLEMDTLESWLLSGDLKQEEWARHEVGAHKADVAWTLSGGKGGKNEDRRE